LLFALSEQTAKNICEWGQTLPLSKFCKILQNALGRQAEQKAASVSKRWFPSLSSLTPAQLNWPNNAIFLPLRICSGGIKGESKINSVPRQ